MVSAVSSPFPKRLIPEASAGRRTAPPLVLLGSLLVLAALLLPPAVSSALAGTTLYWTNETTNNNWSTSAADSNWTDNPGGVAADKRFDTGDTVIFDSAYASGPSPRTITVAAGGVSMSGMTIQNAGDWLFASNAIGGAGALTMNGRGTATLEKSGTFTGGTTINSGTLQMGNGGTSGGVTGNILNNGVLVFYRSDSGGNPYVLPNKISGSGTLIFKGTGSSNRSAYQGNAANSVFGGRVIVQSGARLELINSSTGTGSGITVQNGGGLWLENGSTYSSPIFIVGNGWTEPQGQLGALRLGGNSKVIGSITLTGNARIAVRGSTGTVSGVISDGAGMYTLEKSENGKLILSGANTYDGGTVISAGTLSVSRDANLGAASGGVSIGAATLQVTDTFTSSRAIALTHATGSTIEVAKEKTLTLAQAAAFAVPGVQLNKTGDGTLALDNLAQSGGALNIASGTVAIKSGTFDRGLTGSGTLAVDRPGAADTFTFTPAANTGFAGTLDVRQGTMRLDDGGNSAVLQTAALKLNPGGSVEVGQNRTMNSLTMNGGTLKFAVDSISPQGVLTVGTLDVSGGGTVMMDLNKAITTVVGMPQSFYDYAASATLAQQKLAGATTLTGSETQLAWKDYAGNALGAVQTRALRDTIANVQTGVATFDYLGTVKNTDTQKGLYLGYGLTQIQAMGGRNVILDSSASTASAPAIRAKLTGSGGFAFGGSKNVFVGNTANDYSGATVIQNLTLTMLTNNALGQSSALNLTGMGKLNMNGKSQIVGSLNGVAATEITVGALTVTNGGTFAGLLKGSGALTVSGGTLAYSGTQSGGTFTQTGGTLVSADGSTLHDAAFAGTVRPTGTLSLNTGTFTSAVIDLGAAPATNTIRASGSMAFAGTNSISVNSNAVGNYTLLSSLVGISGADSIAVSNSGLGTNRDSVMSAPTALNYKIIGANANLSWNGAAGSRWNTTDRNWRDAEGYAFPFADGDNVTFGSAAQEKTINLDRATTVGAMNVAGSYTFTGNKLTGNSLEKTDPGTLQFENAIEFGSINVSNSVLDITGTATVNGVASLSNDTLRINIATLDKIVANDLRLAGTTTVDLSRLTGGANYTFLTGTNALSGFDPAKLTTLYRGEILDPRIKAGYTSDGANVTVHLALDNLSLTWSGATNNNWQDANWNGSPRNRSIDGDTVTFDDSGINRNIVVDADGVFVGGMLVNNSSGKDYSFSGGGISGASITKTGSGTLSINNDLSAFTGTFTQQGGTVNLSTNLGGTYKQTGGVLNTGGISFGSIDMRNSTFDMTGTVTVKGIASLSNETLRLDPVKLDKIVAADLRLAGTTTVDLNSFINGANYAFLTGTTGLSGFDPAKFTTLYKGATFHPRAGVTYDSDGSNVTVHLVVDNLPLTWSGAASGSWQDANWNGSPQHFFIDGDTVTFDDTGINRNIVVDAGGVHVGGMVVNNSSGKDYSFSGGGISGASITKRGSGTLSLHNDSSAFAGTFTHQGGTVNLSNKLGGTYYQNGGVLNTSGAAGLGSATFKGVLNPTGTLKLSGSAAFNGATVNLGKLTGVNRIIAAGSLSFTGASSTITLDTDNAAAGDYALIASSGGSISGGNLATVVSSLSGAQRGGQFVSGNALMYRLLTGNTALTWAGTLVNAVWDTANTNKNWTDGAISTSFLNGDKVTFTDSAENKSVAVSADGVRVGDMAVNNSFGNAYSFSGGPIVGASLTKTGSGTLALNNAFNAFDSVTVNSGSATITNTLETLRINVAAGSSLRLGTLRLFGGRTLTMNNQGDFAYNTLAVYGRNNRISGAPPSAAGRNLHFILPGNITAGSTLLRVQAPGMDISGAALTLGAANYLNKLKIGDSITLIDNTTGTIAKPTDTYTAAYGASRYLFTLADQPGSLALVYGRQKNNLAKTAKPYLEGGISGLAMVTEGGRTAGTSGVQNMVDSTRQGPGAAIIAGVSGSSYRFDTGSHVDVDGMSVISGPVWRFDNRAGITRLGLFVEAGWGNYDTYNTFANGDGDIEHYGGGLMLRHDWYNGLYAEASFRAGMVSTEFSSGDMGAGAAFDEDTSYLGAHAGLGWIWSVTDKDSFDLYGKFFWTRQNGYTANTDAGEHVRLDDADSLSTRLGARYSHKFTDNVSAYIGAAWDKEFDGKQTGSINGTAINSPSLEGDSAFGELGVSIAPGSSPWSADFKFYGSAGQREGIGGNLSLSYEF